jgi:hypothetical protein
MKRRSFALIASTAVVVLGMASTGANAEMLKQIVIIDSASGGTTIGDRFYFNVHAPETVRQYGPWMQRYWSYRMFNVPAEADRYNPNRGRMTEIWSRVEDSKEMYAIPPAYTPGKGQQGWRMGGTHDEHATVFMPAVPTDLFVPPDGREPVLGEKRYLRWMIALNYPDGVDFEEGEKWFKEVFAQEIKELPGILRFVSWRAHDIMIKSPRCTHKRLVEIWFQSYDEWREVFVENPPQITPPPWADEKGGFETYLEIITGFVGVWPDVDFLNDKLRSP